MNARLVKSALALGTFTLTTNCTTTTNSFVNFSVDKAPKIASVGYVPLLAEAYRINHVHLNKSQVETVFGKESQLDLMLAELLRKQKQF